MNKHTYNSAMAHTHSRPAHSRLLLLAVGLMLTARWPVGATAQPSEQHGKIDRDEPDALRVQDMTMDELQQRLAEYEAGKRDDRDGYIILNQLWFNYQAQSRTASPENWAISKVSVGVESTVAGVAR